MSFIYDDASALISLVLVVLGAGLSFWNIYMHLSNYSRPKLQKFIVRTTRAVSSQDRHCPALGRVLMPFCASRAPQCRICLMIPIYAITSWIAFRYPPTSVWVKTSRDV